MNLVQISWVVFLCVREKMRHVKHFLHMPKNRNARFAGGVRSI